jgi:flagellar biogenesis protein FliO
MPTEFARSHASTVREPQSCCVPPRPTVEAKTTRTVGPTCSHLSRTVLAALTILATCTAFAGDGILGTKASPQIGPMQADTGGVGFMPFLQMIIALGIVLVLLKFVMPKLVTKLNKKIVTKVGSAIQIEESAAFAGGSLYIVKAKSKSLLLSVTTSGVTCLADLGSSNPEHDVPTFQEIIEKEIKGPLQPFAVVEAAIEDESPQRVADALERLKRLAG